VPVRKLDSTDAFLVTDFADAPLAAGVVRAAPKVLVDGAELLARAATYAFATFAVQAGGASAGINTKPEDRETALAAFASEVGPEVTGGRLHLVAGTGLTADDLGDAASAVDEALTARGAVAAATPFLTEGLSDVTAAVHGPESWAEPVAAAWSAAGGGVVAGGAGLDAEVDVLFLAGKAGLLDHEAATAVRAKVLVPLTPVPVTAKAFAALSRAGVVFVPDALSLAAPLLAAAEPDGGDPVERVGRVAAELAPAGVDAWRQMVERAEAFLATWQPSLPFGRPLA
jgi:glutamate dehydrogenase/leucine dehydrogenase